MGVFPFRHPRGEYDLVGEEAQAVEEYNIKHARTLKNMLAFASEFIDRHTWAYNIYKHGISVILAMETMALPEGVDGVVPIFTSGSNLQDIKFILTGPTIAEKLTGFLDSISGISKSLLERRLQMAELGGTSLPLLAHMSSTGNQLVFTPYSWGQKFEKRTTDVFTGVFHRIVGAIERTPIEATLHVDINRSRLEDWVRFYQNDWRVP